MSKLDKFKKALSIFFEKNNTYNKNEFVINPTDDINSEKYNFTIVDRFDVDHHDLFSGIKFQMTIAMLDKNPFSKISFIPPDDEANMPPPPPANNIMPPAPPFHGGIRSAPPPPILKNLSCKVISPVEIDIISYNNGFDNKAIYIALQKMHEKYELAKQIADRLAKERERLAKEKEEADRLAREEADRLAKEKTEEEEKRLAKEKEEADRLAREKADRLARETAEKEEEEEKDRLAKIEADKIAEETKAESDRLAKIETDRIAAEKAKAEEDRLAKIEADRIAAEEASQLAKQIQAANQKTPVPNPVPDPDPKLDILDDKILVKAPPTEKLVKGINVEAIIADKDGQNFMNFVEEFRVKKLQEIIKKRKEREINSIDKMRNGLLDSPEKIEEMREKKRQMKEEIDKKYKYKIEENSDIIRLFKTLPENEQLDILKSLNKALLDGGKCGTSLTYMCSLKEFVKSNKKLNDYLTPLCSKDDKLDYFLKTGTSEEIKERIRMHTQAVNLLYNIMTDQKKSTQEGKKGGKKTRRKYKKQTNHKKSRKSLFQQKHLNS